MRSVLRTVLRLFICRVNLPEIQEVSVNTFLLTPVDIDSRLSVNFQRFVGNYFVDFKLTCTSTIESQSTAPVNCESSLSQA